MNAQFQICGLCILFLLILFYNSHQNLRLYKEKVFFTVLCIITGSLLADIGSLIVIQYRAVLPSVLVNFICKLYIVTLIWGAWSALIYVISDLLPSRKHLRFTGWLALVAALQSLFVFLLPIYIHDEEGAVYTYGPAIMAVYTFVFLYILSTLAVTFFYRQKLNPRRRFATILWMLIWIVAALIQLFNSDLLLVGFASALGVLILFTVIETPEANLERKLGCFNSYALSEYLAQLYELEKDFSLLEISLENESVLKEHGIDANVIIRKLLPLCGKDILVFKNINLSLILISPYTEALRLTGNRIVEMIRSSDEYEKISLLTLFSHANVLSDGEELFHFLDFVRTEYGEEKGRLICADENMLAQFKDRFVLEREITLALAQDRVEVFLQPIYSTKEHRFTSAEALVRIRKQNGELLPPGLFIPIAESNGQIVQLGERVFEKVCEFLQTINAEALGLHYIEVNLSVVQCEKEDLAERLISLSRKYRINPQLINLEITETASIRAQKILLENMKKLITYGFSFSLDDFGKGESNLMYVVEMPVSILKMDYDMSQAFFNNPKAKQVVRAVMEMSHGMGLKVVTEGIEAREQSEQMITEGADYIQGFYYSKPLPVEDFLNFIRQYNG